MIKLDVVSPSQRVEGRHIAIAMVRDNKHPDAAGRVVFDRADLHERTKRDCVRLLGIDLSIRAASRVVRVAKISDADKDRIAHSSISPHEQRITEG